MGPFRAQFEELTPLARQNTINELWNKVSEAESALAAAHNRLDSQDNDMKLLVAENQAIRDLILAVKVEAEDKCALLRGHCREKFTELENAISLSTEDQGGPGECTTTESVPGDT